MSEKVKKYMRLVAKEHCESLDQDEYESLIHERNDLWDEMDLDERDEANELVLDIFEEYL